MKLILIAAIFAASPALAQQATPLEQALGAKLTVEVGAGLQCGVDLINTRAALDKALARIKELEAKEPTDAK